MIRYHMLVSSRVQGVGFRYTASHLDNLYNLTGWVRNCSDGDVEMEVQGDPGNIDFFIQKLQTESRWIRVASLKRKQMPLEPDETVFHVRY